MNPSNRLYIANREAWRQWLMENHKVAKEIWLVYPRNHTGIPRIPYNDAVEEALCFGWIDSITKSIDEDRYSQRFTPRKPRSTYSQTNKERLRRLVEQEKVMPDALAMLGNLLEEPFVFPPDIAAALRANDLAWANFQQYSEAYQRIRVAYVKRLEHLLRKTEQDKQFGFGIETYY